MLHCCYQRSGGEINANKTLPTVLVAVVLSANSSLVLTVAGWVPLVRSKQTIKADLRGTILAVQN